jgi:uncharacterized protein YjeT (DUF2065 family)
MHGRGFMWEELGRAICLVLILEGMLPFLYPSRWRRLVITLAVMTERQLRLVGFMSMAIGVGLLYLLK